MNIRIERLDTRKLGIPAVAFIPERSRAYALVIHGYGGCKEEQFGLAWVMAESRVQAIAIDLRGHGENDRLLDGNVLEDVQNAIAYYKELGTVLTVGHSLGGRLGLLSRSDYKIGISPALSQSFSQATQQFITQMRAHRVRETRPEINFETLHSLPVWGPAETSNYAIVYAARDVPEIKADCEKLKREGVFVEQVDNTSHADIFLSKRSFEIVKNRINFWLPA